ncbi:MAG TPA: hypothetical protein VJQ57_13655 [Acidimicrobiia bacterium]|nr:hypothetical protein [Acidimicrobiia bacterium]
MAERWSTARRFRARMVCNSVVSLPGKGPSVSFSSDEMDLSLNDVLKLVADSSRYLGGPVVQGVGMGPRDAEGRHLAFRWAWEHKLCDGITRTQMLVIKSTDWSKSPRG